MKSPSPRVLHVVSALALGLGLACSGGSAPPPAATAPGAPPPSAPPAGAPRATPGEVALGDTPLSWVQLDQKDGAWVRWKPCDASPGTLRIDPAGRKVVWDVGQEVMEYTLVSGLLVDDDVTLNLTLSGAPETIVLKGLGDGKKTITTQFGTWTFAPAGEAARYPEKAESPCER